MDGKLMAVFIIWAIVGCAFIGLGISAFFSKKAVGFWANAKPFPVEDIKGYNGAVGKLFILYGVGFIALGLPLLRGQNSPFVLLSVFGVMLETIIVMAIYNTRIEKKYKSGRG